MELEFFGNNYFQVDLQEGGSLFAGANEIRIVNAAKTKVTQIVKSGKMYR